MAELVSIVKAIIELAFLIKEKVDTFQYNKEDARKVGELVATVRTIAESLRKNLEEEDGGGGGELVDGALKALKQALERAKGVVIECQVKNTWFRADAIARKLHRVCLDVSLNLSAVVLAYSAHNTSKLGDIHGIVAHINGAVAALRADVAVLHADVADLRADVAEIREMVAALPVALRQQVETLVQTHYTNSGSL